MRTKQFSQLLIFVFSCVSLAAYSFNQGDSGSYVSQFNQLIADSYAAVDDPAEGPSGLLSSCANLGSQSATGTVTVTEVSPTVLNAADVQTRCGETNHCVIGENVTVNIDGSLKLHSLVVNDGGTVVWNDSTQSDSETWLCAGYAVVESGGTWDMDLQDASKRAWIYIMNNGATHMMLRTRAFGSSYMGTGEEPHLSVVGRELERTWSLLAEPLTPNSTFVRVMHDPIAMGWQVGDRIAVAPTEGNQDSQAQDFFIGALQADGLITLNEHSNGSTHMAERTATGEVASLRAAEVINLSRNIIVTGDDFEEVACSNEFAEEYNFGTSTQGCLCDGNRTSCTVGLNTASAHGGYSEIANVRLEKCGQRGIEGKYCLHFHHMQDCADDSLESGSRCISRNNAVEFSQQRAQIVHSTHNALVDSNVYYDVRGANLYVEDGNEMLNKLTYNVGICPSGQNGCTLPGTSNDQGDTQLNQSGIYMISPNNLLVGNRMANFRNGMFNEAGGGRGPVGGQVCGGNVALGHWEGNTFHSNGRFGTYLLNGNYPLQNTGQSLMTNGTTNGCDVYDGAGNDMGLSSTIVSSFDYNNNFVGQYGGGDLQYKNHVSGRGGSAIYWKESKTMQDGCSAQVSGAHWIDGGANLPDVLGAFIIENATLDDITLNNSHHCDVGGTGILCFPRYILDDVTWLDPSNIDMRFETQQNSEGNQFINGGGIFALSPDSIAANQLAVANGQAIEFNSFPYPYTSIASKKFPYLLNIGATCRTTEEIGTLIGEDLSGRYRTNWSSDHHAIMCEETLSAVRILANGGGGDIRVRVYDNEGGGGLLAEQTVPRVVVSENSNKQGYSFPVIPGTKYRYEVSLNGAAIPESWVISFGDLTVSNRWGEEELQLDVEGRNCGGTIYSNHDRRFFASPEEYGEQMYGRGACTDHPPMTAQDCSVTPDLTLNSDSSYDDWKTVAADACSTIDCGENGICSAQYLGSDVPVLPTYQCVCEEGYFGNNCESGEPLPTPVFTPPVIIPTTTPPATPTSQPTPNPTATPGPDGETPTATATPGPDGETPTVTATPGPDGETPTATATPGPDGETPTATPGPSGVTPGPSGGTNTPSIGGSSDSGGGGSISWTGLMMLLLLGAQWMRGRPLPLSRKP